MDISFPKAAPRPWTLQTRLALWFCLVSVALTLVLVVVIEVASTTRLREQIGMSLGELAYQTTDKLDQRMFERYREMQLLAVRPTFGDPSVALAEKQHILDQLQQTYPVYSWIGMTDLDGKVLAATGGLLAGGDVSQRPWFMQAFQDINIGDVHEAKLLANKLPNPTGEPLRFVDVAFPYRDASGRILGIIGAHMSWKWAEEIQQSVITEALARRGIEGYIVAQNGVVLLGPPGTVGSELPFPSLDAIRRGSAGFAVERGADGKDYVVGYDRTRGRRSYPGLGWSVLVRQPVSEAYAPVRALQRRVLWSGLVIAFLFSLFGVLNAKRITRSLDSLAEAARDLRLGRSTTLGAVPKSYPEVNELAASMASLVRNLQKNQTALQELNVSLERRVAERTAELAASEARLRTITDSIPALIAYVDRNRRYGFCNRAYDEWFHPHGGAIVGERTEDVLSPAAHGDAAPYMEQALQGHAVTFERPHRRDGRLHHLKFEYIPHVDDGGSVAGFFVVAHDITESKNLQAALQQDLLTDALTGLANRVAYLQQLSAAIARSRRSRKPLAVMFLDVDKFKSINDTHGHEAGDKVLVEFARRVRGCLRESDTVARFAGDEFVILVENLGAPEADAKRVAENIVTAVRTAIPIDGHALTISTSIGIAVWDDRGDTPEDLLKKADAAMYDAKRAGRNRVVFYGERPAVNA